MCKFRIFRRYYFYEADRLYVALFSKGDIYHCPRFIGLEVMKIEETFREKINKAEKNETRLEIAEGGDKFTEEEIK